MSGDSIYNQKKAGDADEFYTDFAYCLKQFRERVEAEEKFRQECNGIYTDDDLGRVREYSAGSDLACAVLAGYVCSNWKHIMYSPESVEDMYTPKELKDIGTL